MDGEGKTGSRAGSRAGTPTPTDKDKNGEAKDGGSGNGKRILTCKEIIKTHYIAYHDESLVSGVDFILCILYHDIKKSTNVY